MTVFVGPNEAGKSTLLEFVRRVLFGFPRKSGRVNPYPALGGGEIWRSRFHRRYGRSSVRLAQNDGGKLQG